VKTVMLTACEFRRSKSSTIERGIMVNEGQMLIDADGQVVSAPIANYWMCYYDFCVRLPMEDKQ
jgi:hypothetical protein